MRTNKLGNNMKHVVRISDGMGNQMFQYAFAYALQKETGAHVVLDPFFWGTSLRKYRLNEFNISMNERLISPSLDYILGFGPRNGRRFKEKYRNFLIERKFVTVSENEIMHYDSAVMTQEKDSFFLGFWQTGKYFDKYRDDIIQEFSLRKKLSPKAVDYIEKIETSDIHTIAVHIRRTDYVRESGSSAITMQFYEDAISYIEKQLNSYRLYIFSDDKSFVTDYFRGRAVTFVEGVDDLEEFEIMKKCRHKIIANSTYSWWAAYLGEKDGMVIAPCVGIWKGDYYPSDWILLDAEI